MPLDVAGRNVNRAYERDSAACRRHVMALAQSNYARSLLYATEAGAKLVHLCDDVERKPCLRMQKLDLASTVGLVASCNMKSLMFFYTLINLTLSSYYIATLYYSSRRRVEHNDEGTLLRS